MSHITDILLITDLDDEDTASRLLNFHELNAWLMAEFGAGHKLAKVSHVASGIKAMQCDVFAVAVNGCDIGPLVAAFRAIPWQCPESAQLMVKDEGWDRFVVYRAMPGADGAYPDPAVWLGDDGRIVPHEFYGPWAELHPEEAARLGCIPLYGKSAMDEAVAEAIERCAKLCEGSDKSTHPTDLADMIRKLKAAA